MYFDYFYSTKFPYYNFFQDILVVNTLFNEVDGTLYIGMLFVVYKN